MTKLIDAIQAQVLGRVVLRETMGPLSVTVDATKDIVDGEMSTGTSVVLRLTWASKVVIRNSRYDADLLEAKQALVKRAKYTLYNDLLDSLHDLEDALRMYDIRRALNVLSRVEEEVMR